MASDKPCSPCYFDTLISKNLPHILEKIFFSLDYESFKNCLEVSNEWKSVLTSDRYITKGKSVFKEGITKDEKQILVAANKGNKDDVRVLLASGMVDVNCKDCEGCAPLHNAALNGNKELAKFLIDRGAQPNVTDKNGGTPLHRASFLGHKDFALLLIERGADVNVACRAGQTPLHLAAICSHKEVAELLVEHGADMDKENLDGRSPRQYNPSW